MKPFLFAFLICPAAAMADCRAEITALFDGGALDPFAHPPHRIDTLSTTEDGTEVSRYLTFWDTPSRSINGTPETGPFWLSIGNDTWQGPTPDGPWSPLGVMAGDPVEDVHRATRDEMAANVSEEECLGTVALDGREVLSYAYRTQTDPGDDGVYFGGTYTIFVDPESGHLLRVETEDFIAHYQPTPSTGRTVSVHSYDDPRTITPPEGG
jgi:hypothetical protein